MNEVLRFFRNYEIWLYLLLSLGLLIYLRKFLVSWQELRGAVFGLERESAQGRLNQAASILALLIILMVAEFVLVSFVAPLHPGSSPLPTTTLNPLATPTTTLPPASTETGGTPQPTFTPLPTIELASSNCLPGQSQITFPDSGAQIEGEVTIEGTAFITNFGFYKLEVARRQESLWRTIQAGRETVQNGILVELWDTTSLEPGDYVLRLVVTNTDGENLPDCRIPIQIVSP